MYVYPFSQKKTYQFVYNKRELLRVKTNVKYSCQLKIATIATLVYLQ